jgi:hypothetical protein
MGLGILGLTDGARIIFLPIRLTFSFVRLTEEDLPIILFNSCIVGCGLTLCGGFPDIVRMFFAIAIYIGCPAGPDGGTCGCPAGCPGCPVGGC